MKPPQEPGPRLRLHGEGEAESREDFARAVAAGLDAEPKTLPCRFFYDAEGSRLFEEICRLPEYYPTRTEAAILRAEAVGLAEALAPLGALAELGSGSAVKTRLLLEALLERQASLLYAPVDISRSMLEESSRALLRDYPGLRIEGVAGEYAAGLRLLPSLPAPRAVLWLGSNIGNLDRTEACSFLARVRTALDPEDRFLLGVDLRKEIPLLLAAYDDAQGVTARFNLNLLVRLQRELGAELPLAAFRHEARWNEAEGRIEMHLVAREPVTLRVAALGRSWRLEAGESIHTENSCKYAPEEVEALAAGAGFEVERACYDPRRWFGLFLLAPRAGAPD